MNGSARRTVVRVEVLMRVMMAAITMLALAGCVDDDFYVRDIYTHGGQLFAEKCQVEAPDDCHIEPVQEGPAPPPVRHTKWVKTADGTMEYEVPDDAPATP